MRRSCPDWLARPISCAGGAGADRPYRRVCSIAIPLPGMDQQEADGLFRLELRLRNAKGGSCRTHSGMASSGPLSNGSLGRTRGSVAQPGARYPLRSGRGDRMAPRPTCLRVCSRALTGSARRHAVSATTRGWKIRQGLGPTSTGSAYHLSGVARHDWKHSIVEMDLPRCSITFRRASEKGHPVFGIELIFFPEPDTSRE